MPHRPLLLLSIVLCACAEPATDPPGPTSTEPESAVLLPAPTPRDSVVTRLTPLGRESFDRLLHAQRFTSDAIYVGGDTPVEVVALRNLWREPEGAAALRELEQRATLPGRLFALCGLFYADRAAFDERVEAYRGTDATVFFQEGCIGMRDYPAVDLVERTSGGVVHLEGDQTIKAWLAAHDNPNGTKGGYGYDILGGGWSNVFRDGGGFYEVHAESFDQAAD